MRATRGLVGIACAVSLVGIWVLETPGLLAAQTGSAAAPPITAPGANVYIVSAAAAAAGLAGSRWASDVVIHNPGSSNAAVNLYFMKSDRDNTATASRLVTVPGGQSIKLANLVSATFGETSASGAVLIGSDSRLMVTSRTFNDATSGTFGQYIEGYPALRAVGADEQVRLIQLTKSADYRTNIGLANITGNQVTIQARFFRADGSSVGGQVYTVPAYGYHQDSDVFAKLNAASVEIGYAVVSSSTPGARYFAYASVIDNRTNDPVCVVPVGRAGAPGTGPTTPVRSLLPESGLEHSAQPVAADRPAPGSGPAAGTTWVGNGPSSGWILDLVVDAVTPETLYAATSGGGVFKSTNGGTSWSAVTVGLEDLTTHSLAMDPTRPQVVFAGTDTGVFKTTTGGTSWSSARTGMPMISVRALAVDPASPDTIFAGTREGIYKTTNGGAFWSRVDQGLTNPSINALAMDPKAPWTVYAATDKGVVKTTNGGGTWADASTDLASPVVRDLAIDPGNPQTVYAATWGGGTYKTENGGRWWAQSATGQENLYLSSLVIDPKSPATLYAASHGGGIIKTTSAGSWWYSTNSGLSANSTIETLAIDPRSPTTLYAGARGGGVFKSTSRGGSWTAVNTGLVASVVHGLAIDPTSPPTVYAAVFGGGIFKSASGGADWSPVNSGLANLSALALAIDPTDPRTLYVGTYDGLFKTRNNGRSWLPSGLEGRLILAIAVDPANPQTVYAGTDGQGIFRTTSGGSAWSSVYEPADLELDVMALAIDPQAPATVYAGTNLNGVMKSTNGGLSWSEVNVGLGSKDVTVLMVDPQDPRTVWAGSADGGAFKTTNGGVSWSAAGSGIADTGIACLAIDPSDSQIVYAGTAAGGVHQSLDGGDSWSPLTSDLRLAGTRALAVEAGSPGALWVGTTGNGVFRGTPDTCRYALGESAATVPSSGASRTVDVAASPGCPWTAASSVSWIMITSGSGGTGNGTVAYAVAANPSTSARTGTLTIAGQTLTVTQPGIICTPPAAPTLTAPATGVSDRPYTLSWNATSPDGTYEFQQSTASTFDGAATVSVNATSWPASHTVTGTAAVTWYARVRAVAACGGGTYVSPWSNVGQTVVGPPQPSGDILYVPAAAHATGTAGTNWKTDLEVHNPGTSPARFDLALLKKDQDNTSPSLASFTLEGGRSTRYADVLSSSAVGFGYSGSGTLKVTPWAGTVMVTSRTYNDQPGGTFGQFIPGQPEGEAIAAGDEARLIQLAQSMASGTGFRTNLGLVNATGLTISVEVRLCKGEGSCLGTQSITLPPYGFRQINEIYRTVTNQDVADGYAVLRTTTTGGAFFAYASVIDSRSGDPIYIPARIVD